VALILACLATSDGLAQGTPQTKAADHLVAPAVLAALLPALEGWTKSEPLLNKVESPSCAYTLASTTYTKGDMRVKLTIADSGMNNDSLMAVAAMVMTLPDGYSDTIPPATTVARVKINEMPAAEMWDAEALKGELTVLVNGRFAVAIEARKADSLGTLRAMVGAVDLKALAAQK
jgi:hypothetical protein